MRRKQLAVFITLLLFAALLGWLLPVAVFHLNDRMKEGKTTELSIRQYDLSYQSDLDPASRLRLVQHDVTVSSTVPLERGIYLRRQDVVDIAEQFIRDLSGLSFSLSGRYEIVPVLLTFPKEGTIIVWIVNVELNNAWTCECMIDDQTGLILRCSFRCYPWQWDKLIKDPDSVPNVEAYISIRTANALSKHFNTRLDTELTANVKQENITDDELFTADVILSKDGQTAFVIPLSFISQEGYLSIN